MRACNETFFVRLGWSWLGGVSMTFLKYSLIVKVMLVDCLDLSIPHIYYAALYTLQMTWLVLLTV